MNRIEIQRIPRKKRFLTLMPQQFFGGRKDRIWRQRRFLERSGLILTPVHTQGFPTEIAIYYINFPHDFSKRRAILLLRMIRSSGDLAQFRRTLSPVLTNLAGQNLRLR
jgi:hypothetical protein